MPTPTLSSKMNALVAWSQVMPNLGKEDIIALHKFGQRFGTKAMVDRASSIVRKRNVVPKQYITTIKAKFDSLGGMLAMRQSSIKKSETPVKNQAIARKRAAFVRGFAKRSKPIVQSMLTLAFTRKVVEVWLSQDEIARLTGSGATNREVAEFKSLLEKRSGQTIAQLMKDVQRQVEHDLSQMWAANLKDAVTLAQNPAKGREYEEILQSGNLAALTNFYLKGIH